MAALKAASLLVAAFWSAPAAADYVDRWAPLVAEASERFRIPEEWIRRVIKAESGGRTRLGGRPIESSAGALGLMQLMPGTWRAARARYGLGSDPHQPRDNILAGAAYLREMYDRFGYPGLFAAYNAGPARYANHLSSGRALPAETVAYVAAVARRGSEGSDMSLPISGSSAVSAPARLFVIVPNGGERLHVAVPSEPAEQSALFVKLGSDLPRRD